MKAIRGGRMPERWDYRNREDVRDYDREHSRRGPMERAGDEVRSWFGDDGAARRRRLDETRSDRDRSWTDRDRNPVERTWDRTRETVRDVTDRDRDGRRARAGGRPRRRAWHRAHRPRARPRLFGRGTPTIGREAWAMGAGTRRLIPTRH